MLQLHDQTWTIDPKCIRSALIQHFKGIYCEPDNSPRVWPNEILQSLQNIIPTIQQELLDNLQQMPTQEEIAASVFSLGPDRADGPDGLNACFVQKFWNFLKSTVEQEVVRFFVTAEMPIELSKANMVLILKIDNPTKVSDYRPISICNVIYKIIFKILANPMKPIIHLLVHPNQVAFTPGRQISDQIILTREILHTFSHS